MIPSPSSIAVMTNVDQFESSIQLQKWGELVIKLPRRARALLTHRVSALCHIWQSCVGTPIPASQASVKGADIVAPMFLVEPKNVRTDLTLGYPGDTVSSRARE